MPYDEFDQFVPKYFQMDPEIDDLLPQGTDLMEGMEVLIEDCSIRADIHEGMSEIELETARRNNRWATVSDIRLLGVDMISFVSTYFDGDKKKRVENVDTAWYVKKDSVPEDERYNKVLEIVTDAMAHQKTLVFKQEEIYAELATRKIMDIFLPGKST